MSEALHLLPALRSLDYSAASARARKLSLAGAPNLARLILSGSAIDELKDVDSVRALKTLDVSHCPNAAVFLADTLRACRTSLRQLWLVCPLTVPVLFELLAGMPCLKQLVASGTTLVWTLEMLQKLRKACPSLRRLYLNNSFFHESCKGNVLRSFDDEIFTLTAKHPTFVEN